MLNRFVTIGLFLVFVAAAAAGTWGYAYRQALGQVAARGEADLALAADRLIAQLKRYRELAVLMAEHPVLDALSRDAGDAEEAARLLLEAADKTSALTLYYLAPDGRVLAAAHDSVPQDVARTDYFTRAAGGALGSGHGVYDSTGRRAYYYAAPSFGADGRVQGVLVAVADIEYVEWDWRGGRPTVFFLDGAGRVFISNRSELVGWQRDTGETGVHPVGGDTPPVRALWTGTHEVWHLDWGAYVPRRALHLTTDLPVIGFTGEALVAVETAERLAWLQAAVVAAVLLAFGTILFVLVERRRTLTRANLVLEARVAERTAELSTTNETLRQEVHDRMEAEAALRQAQADLVQAGKLSALGHMSAGISHELNQPLMAIQQYAANGAQFLSRGNTETAEQNLTRIAQMAARMSRIIKNLRAFARNESEPLNKVDLAGVIDAAVELTEARLAASGITLDWQPPRVPVHALAGEVRLTQVFVNLITNAADAMEDQASEKSIRIAVTAGRKLSVTVRDTGPGIREPEKIFEPFYSTKAVGSSEGMGLGLSISYGLVQSFGGRIRGTNASGGGALFTVELEYWRAEKAA